jgi:CHRD domain/Neocarzinostatin family
MGTNLRAGLAVVAAVVLTTVLWPQAAGAQVAPTIEVVPGDGLQDGQSVGVFGGGFSPGTTIVGLAQCVTGSQFPGDCVGQSVITTTDGEYSSSFSVVRFVGAVDCASAPGACFIGASNLNGPGGAFVDQAVAPLSFGPPARILQSTLTGLREVGPDGSLGAGEVDGVGAATVAVRSDSICASISVTGVELPALAAHIHDAPAGVNGPIVVPLTPPGADGRSDACVEGVAPSLLAALGSDPARFYVNVHTTAFPNGALRGQLQDAAREGPLLATRLSGSQEIGPDGGPGAGDPDGGAVATVAANPEAGRLCFEIWARGIALPAVAAHIHEGRPGQNGGIVVPLAAPDADGRASGCVRGLDFTTVWDIARDPGAYYVNVHTSEYPDGAVRGQLFAAAASSADEDVVPPA